MKSAKLASIGALCCSSHQVEPWPGRSVTLDATSTYVRETPALSADAEPALYVHGLGGSSLNWTDLAGLLSYRLDGQSIDLPGFGRSDPAARYTIDALSHRVIRWIEASDRGPVHLIGNSLGGALSVTVAATRPDLVRTLTLISPALPFLDPRRSAQRRLLPLVAVPGADRLAARRFAMFSPEEITLQVFEACFGDPKRINPRRLAEAIEEGHHRVEVPWYADAYVRTLRGLVGSFLRAYLPGTGSLWRTAARVTVPTLVIGGDLDRLVDVRVAPQAAQLIRDARLLMLSGVGHVAQMETPELVARAIVGLLDDVRANPPVVPATRSYA
jgi:pimeloyl-ACP methyl ester carboxylesterase